jgi:CubicO group peptidase (beta-lactamase class C family)
MFRGPLWLFVPSALSMAATWGPAAADEFDGVRAQIEARLVASDVPSLAVAVARDGRIVWEQGFGWADREARRPSTEHTLYSLASITKPIAATALLVLAERGVVDLDRPANDYLGDAFLNARVGDASAATLRRLANHTAGLPLHYHFFYADELHRPPPRDESIRRYGQIVSPPGETYRYANFGYGVLDYVIERKGGAPFGEFLRREVFLPLGMNHSSLGIGAGLEHQYAVRYAEDQSRLPMYDFDHPGASAVWASAHDLARFGLTHLKRRLPDQRAILSDAAIDAMQVPTADVGDGVGYGIGWFINPNEHGIRTVGHGGGMGGVRTRLVLAPEQGIVVAVLSNSASELPVEIARQILAALVPAYGESLGRQAAGPASAGSTASPPATFVAGPELIGRWQGAVATHEGDRPIELDFKESGDIHVRLEGQLKTLVSEARFEGDRLTGVFAGDVGTEDANRRPGHLYLDLVLRGRVLNGSLTAKSHPSPRPGNALSHWIELMRTSDADGRADSEPLSGD